MLTYPYLCRIYYVEFICRIIYQIHRCLNNFHAEAHRICTLETYDNFNIGNRNNI